MATVTIYFDKSKSKTDSYSVLWSVRHQRQCRTFATGMIFPEDYVLFLRDHLNGLQIKPKDKPKYQEEIRVWEILYGETYISDCGSKTMCGYLRRAQEVINDLGDKFNFADFRTNLADFNPDLTPVDGSDISLYEKKQILVFEYLQAQKDAMYKEERFGTGDSFIDTKSSLARYANYKEFGDPIEFKHIDSKFLEEYENWMSKFGKAAKKEGKLNTAASPNTIGIYMRNIRTVFNIAIKDKEISKDIYPFGLHGHLIPKSKNVKKARPLGDIETLMLHKPTTEGQGYAKDMWLFSYMGNGANMADIARLQWKSMEQGEFQFVRRKTRLTRKHNLSPIQVFMNEVAVDIIKRWGNPDTGDGEQFVFKIINHDQTPHQQHRIIKNFIRNVNARMKVLAKQAGIKGKLNTLVARHSFSTIMKHSGTDLITVSKMIGHASITTTMNYLEDFPDQVVKRQLRNLMPKPKKVKA
ncbi:site-specific integrase [Dyadobacter sp. CY312]|uniref:tyrosine-type recombinase/integrase n=1 Tax=Dyadobacter sp. CY312 TaxID=2907303 RepID=UPI001F1C593A|nr:site-specific integrase [Dyadobacter sp. CY312]MCE7039164.1 site-specific integrase [Dyadobacter sp. CY312]